MVQILESKTTDNVGKYWYSLSCDEGDTKPTGEFPADSGKTIADGSRLFENGTEIRYELQSGVWVAIGQKEVTLTTKTITENDTYNAVDDDADGYSSVTVNVPTGAEPFNVTITGQGEPGSYTFSANKTYSETMVAIQNGDIMSFAIIIPDEGTFNAVGYFTMLTETDEIITVVMMAEDTSFKGILCIKWYSDDTFEQAMYIPQQ